MVVYFILLFLLSAYISCADDFFSCVDGLAAARTNIRAAKLLSELRCVGVIGWPVLLRPAINRHNSVKNHTKEDVLKNVHAALSTVDGDHQAPQKGKKSIKIL